MNFVNGTILNVFWIGIIWIPMIFYGLIILTRTMENSNANERLDKIKNFSGFNRYFLGAFEVGFLFLIGLFLSLLILRPSLGEENSSSSGSDLDIALVMDISLSMNTEDINNSSRLNAAKNAADQIIDSDNGSRLSIISFHGKSNIELPLTSDTNTAKTGIDTLRSVGSFAAKGTVISEALNEAFLQLTNENDIFGEDRKKIIILFSDGEQIGDNTELDSILKKISDYGIRIFTFGVGTEEGGRIPEYSFDSGQKLYVRYQGEYVISKLEESTLTKISDATDGEYTKLENNFDAEPLLNILKESSQTSVVDGQKIYKETYFIFAPFIILFLIVFMMKPYNFAKLIRKKT
ncbi:MAG TPA: VWA domain-containing protein [Candidatus Dojkabacteria bacterium]|jgi:Ca-activated chloride channel family protein